MFFFRAPPRLSRPRAKNLSAAKPYDATLETVFPHVVFYAEDERLKHLLHRRKRPCRSVLRLRPFSYPVFFPESETHLTFKSPDSALRLSFLRLVSWSLFLTTPSRSRSAITRSSSNALPLRHYPAFLVEYHALAVEDKFVPARLPYYSKPLWPRYPWPAPRPSPPLS